MKINIKGYIILIDREDYKKISKYTWNIIKPSDSRIYFQAFIKGNKNKKYIRLHRFIMNTPKNKVCDHKNANWFDNRKKNLRNCTQTQNNQNKRISKNNISGFKGASKNKDGWTAEIRFFGKRIYLGYFNDPKEAHQAYCLAAKKYHGEFARIE